MSSGAVRSRSILSNQSTRPLAPTLERLPETIDSLRPQAAQTDHLGLVSVAHVDVDQELVGRGGRHGANLGLRKAPLERDVSLLVVLGLWHRVLHAELAEHAASVGRPQILSLVVQLVVVLLQRHVQTAALLGRPVNVVPSVWQPRRLSPLAVSRLFKVLQLSGEILEARREDADDVAREGIMVQEGDLDLARQRRYVHGEPDFFSYRRSQGGPGGALDGDWLRLDYGVRRSLDLEEGVDARQSDAADALVQDGQVFHRVDAEHEPLELLLHRWRHHGAGRTAFATFVFFLFLLFRVDVRLVVRTDNRQAELDVAGDADVTFSGVGEGDPLPEHLVVRLEVHIGRIQRVDADDVAGVCQILVHRGDADDAVLELFLGKVLDLHHELLVEDGAPHGLDASGGDSLAEGLDEDDGIAGAFEVLRGEFARLDDVDSQRVVTIEDLDAGQLLQALLLQLLGRDRGLLLFLFGLFRRGVEIVVDIAFFGVLRAAQGLGDLSDDAVLFLLPAGPHYLGAAGGVHPAVAKPQAASLDPILHAAAV
eukprot:scaffold193_cov255-Pinguiococcus_pyrenoidosus.AAC.29